MHDPTLDPLEVQTYALAGSRNKDESAKRMNAALGRGRVLKRLE